MTLPSAPWEVVYVTDPGMIWLWPPGDGLYCGWLYGSFCGGAVWYGEAALYGEDDLYISAKSLGL